MATMFMDLTLPSPQRPGAWGTILNADLEIIDAHDHTEDAGQRLLTRSIVIDAQLNLAAFVLEMPGAVAYANNAASPAVDNSTFMEGGNFFFTDGDGIDIQITNQGALNLIGVGGIQRDYASSGAVVFFTDATSTYTFQDSQSNLAPLGFKQADLDEDLNVGDALNVAGNGTFNGPVILNAHVSGPGSIPIGAVLGFQ